MASRFLFLIIVLCLFDNAATGASSNVCLMTTQAICTRVIDGDTIVLDKTERLRLCGINAPEIFFHGRPMKHPPQTGMEAKDLVTSLTLGQKLRIDLQGHRDRYGRLLGWVWLPDGKLLNAEIARCGLAVPMRGCSPASVMQRVSEASLEAKQCREGMWKVRP